MSEEEDHAKTAIAIELEKLPEEFQMAVYNMAYENGHSSGHTQVLCNVYDLVDMLEPCITKFESRIKNG